MGESVEPRRPSPKPVAAEGGDARKADAPGVHAPSTRVTIAWPFSQIKLQEASEELKDLTGLLIELVDALADVVAEERLAPLRDRAQALRARLR